MPLHAPLFWLRDGVVPWLLRPFAWVFGALVAMRRLAFRRGWLSQQRLAVPVIVVGNRIVGGAGKTPATLALLHALAHAGLRCGVVSRGYGADAAVPRAVTEASHAADVGDEPVLIRRRAQMPVWVGRDRVAAARALLAQDPAIGVIVCDDGLQHLRLARDVEVVVFDERGAGNGLLLPAGPLREPIDAAPIDAKQVVLYNAEAPTTPLRGFTATRALQGAVELAAWWAGEPATATALTALRGQPVLAVAGMAHPPRFFAALRAAGLSVDECPQPDHAPYDTLPWPAHATQIVVTEKDAVKLDAPRVARERPGCTVWVVPLAFTPEPAFFDAVIAALPKR